MKIISHLYLRQGRVLHRHDLCSWIVVVLRFGTPSVLIIQQCFLDKTGEVPRSAPSLPTDTEASKNPFRS